MALNRNEVGLQFVLTVDSVGAVTEIKRITNAFILMGKNIRQEVGLINGSLDQLAKAAQRTGERVGDSFREPMERARQSTSSLQEAFTNLGNVLTVGVTAPLVAAGTAAVKAALDFDKTRNQLVALTGSADEANRVIARLRKLVAETPGLTQSFAQSIFNQLKALRTIGDETILQITRAIGTLSANVGLPDPNQFARNLTQIFSQGFERSDIKEALGQVPFFEDILESVFGTKDPEKLKRLQQAGFLTMETFLKGFAVGVEARLPEAAETFTSRFQKAIDKLTIAITPLGTRIIEAVLPPLEKLINILVRVLDAFNSLSPGTQEFIVKMGLVAAAIGPTILGLTKLFEALSRLGPLIGTAGGAGLIGQLGRLGTAFSALATSNPVMAAAILGIGALALAFMNLDETIAGLKKDFADIEKDPEEFFLRPFRKQRDVALQNADRLDRAVRSGLGLPEKQYPRLMAAEAPQAALPAGVGEFGPAAKPLTEAQLMQRQLRMQYEARLKGMKDAQAKGVKATIDFNKLIRAIEEEQGQQSLRILDAETTQRLAALKQRYDNEEITLRQFNNERFRLQIEQANRELGAIKAQGAALLAEQSGTKNRQEQLKIERELLRVRTDQTLKEMEIAQILKDQQQSLITQLPIVKANAQEMINKALPSLLAGSLEAVRNLIEAARKRLAEQISKLQVDAINKQRQIIRIENDLNLGIIERSDAQKKINDLLKEERALRREALELQIESGQMTDEDAARAKKELESIRGEGDAFKTMGMGDALQSVFESIRQPAEMVQDALMGMKAAGQQALEVMILTGQFSGQAFMKAAKQAIAAMTAEAAVAAIMHIAKGFAFLAIGQPANAATAFKAAAAFKLVGTIAGGAAASLALGAIAPGGASESGGTGGRFVTGGTGRPETISLIQGQQGNRREPQVIVIRAETEPGVVIRKVMENYRENGEMRQLIRQDIMAGGTI